MKVKLKLEIKKFRSPRHIKSQFWKHIARPFNKAFDEFRSTARALIGSKECPTTAFYFYKKREVKTSEVDRAFLNFFDPAPSESEIARCALRPIGSYYKERPLYLAIFYVDGTASVRQDDTSSWPSMKSGDWETVLKQILEFVEGQLSALNGTEQTFQRFRKAIETFN